MNRLTAPSLRRTRATGYVTLAERSLDPKDFPGMRPELLVPGAVVFTPPDGLVDLVDFSRARSRNGLQVIGAGRDNVSAGGFSASILYLPASRTLAHPAPVPPLIGP